MEMSEAAKPDGQFQEGCDEGLNLSPDTPKNGKCKLLYSVSDIPPIGVTVLLAFQVLNLKK